MSYSFNVQARTKAEAHQRLTAEFDAVLTSQPVHEADLAAARAAAAAFVDVLKEPTEKQAIKVAVSGSVGQITDGVFVAASFAVTATLGPRDDG